MTAWERTGPGDRPAPRRQSPSDAAPASWLNRILGRASPSRARGPASPGLEADPRIAAAVAIGAAFAVEEIARPHQGPLDAHRISEIARQIEAIWALWRRFPGRARSVLWVDHEPNAHAQERLAFTTLTIDVVLANDVPAALAACSQRSFSLIITSLDRPDEPKAAFRLIEALRSRNVAAPVVVYDAMTETDRADARRRGLLDGADNPQDLLRLVYRALLISMARAPD